MLVVHNLKAYYNKLQVLFNISFHIKKGEIVSILGANGAGKTTLLNSIMGIIKKKQGKILLNDNNIINLKTEKIVRKGITQTPEGRQVFDSLSVYDNLILGAYTQFRKKSKKTILKKLDYIFDLFPVLKERKNGYAGYLSGGEQQMLVIGRALMSNPEILLLDEPSTGLAPKITLQIFEIIKKLSNDNITIVVVEQNANIALKFSDRAYILENGSIILEGESEELLDNKEVQHAYLGTNLKTKWDR